MIGLLRKDQMTLVGAYKKNLVILILLYTALSFFLDNMYFLLYALIFVGGAYVSSTLSFDETSRWDTYARTLPVTPAQIVGVKYLLTLVWTLLFTAAATALLCLRELVRGGSPMTMNGPVIALSCLSTFAVVLFYSAVTMPLSYRFGAARARSATILAMAVLVAAGIFVGGMVARNLRFDPADLTLVQVLGAVAVALAAALAAFAGSLWVSIALYRRKEF